MNVNFCIFCSSSKYDEIIIFNITYDQFSKVIYGVIFPYLAQHTKSSTVALNSFGLVRKQTPSKSE